MGSSDDKKSAEKPRGNMHGASKAKSRTAIYEVYFSERHAPAEGPTRLRHIRPYVHQFKARAKGRWIGRPVIEILSAEFFGNPPDFYSHALKSGVITVNGGRVGDDYKVKGGDAFVHHAHVHEPPVDGRELQIIAKTDDVIVVSKPGSVPVHPAGAYRYNSLPFILESADNGSASGDPEVSSMDSSSTHLAVASRDAGGGANEGGAVVASELHVVHRLDRLTSGVQILARSASSARSLAQDIKDGDASKVYLARVVGEFGVSFDNRWRRERLGGDDEAHFEVGWTQGSEGPAAVDQGIGAGAAAVHPWIKVHQPIVCTSQSGSVHAVAAEDSSVRTVDCSPLSQGSVATHGVLQPKAAATWFRLLSFDGTTSIVECHPLHGRTHQIRLHLQFLNHPIANDPCYGGVEPWIRPRGTSTTPTAAADSAHADAPPLFTLSREPNEDIDTYVTRTCKWCKAAAMYAPARGEVRCAASGAGAAATTAPATATAVREELFQSCIWLHAWRYSCKNEATGREWSYEAPVPEWWVSDACRDP